MTSNRRRILCVFPHYERSFGTLHHAYRLMKGVKAFMPPQGILVIAAYLPKTWEVRFVDENIRPARPEDFRWADAVFTSGMHIQKNQINSIVERAHRYGKIVVVGGCSVSGCPEYYPDADLLHIGEMGDATDDIIAHLDRSVERPATQIRFETRERLPLTEFPVPAYHLLDMSQYFLGSIQFSSGCPYRCEFCDIPELYGRNPRLKTPQQVCAELDAMLAAGGLNAVYFVDDNFIGNRHAALELLPHIIAWQQKNRYPIEFACEATLNIAKITRLLELMREARFNTIFCGIETPEVEALNAMSKQHNLQVPLFESIHTLNSYGFEVVSGIIMGLDTDTPETGKHIVEFVKQSKIPMLTINMLHALPRTPLWRRLEKEGRLLDDPRLESNVLFKLPYEQVVKSWRETIAEVYAPEALYERYKHNIEFTYRNRMSVDNSGRNTWSNITQGLVILFKLIWLIGIRGVGDYRKTFWKLAWPLIKKGDVEPLIHTALVAHHLILFTRECQSGEESASFYAQRIKTPPQPQPERQPATAQRAG
jgi:radical SAM superfamily enzyme YgiQ (UPF0313 family)